MKTTKRIPATAALLLAAALISATSSRGGELSAVKDIQQLSLAQGFGATSPSSLTRGAKDPDQVSAALIKELRPGAPFQKSVVNGALHIKGEQWSLHLSSDGFAAEFRDLAVAARAHSLGLPLSRKMSEALLEEKGFAFIASHLASQIALGPGEQLIALRADYRTEGGQDLVTGETTEAVTGSRIVFGRSIDEVPVVGNGSKVIITFTNDGAVESFRYDWPLYSTGISRPVIPPAEVLARVQSVISVRAGVTFGSPAATTGSAYPLKIASNAQLEALECGYYDAGAKSVMARSVEPGCTYRVVLQDRAGTRTAFAGAVPASASFSADRGWLETQILTAK